MSLNEQQKKSHEESKTSFSPKETAESLLNLVSQRDQEILKLRHGFDTQKPKTLDAIGKIFNLTRERVRQLQNQAVKNIGKHNEYENLTTATRKLILHTLEQFGGFVSLDELIEELNTISKNENDEKNIISFLLKHFMSEAELVRNEEFKPSLRSFNLPLDFVQDVLNHIENIFSERKAILEASQIVKLFKNSEYYKIHEKEFNILLENNGGDLEKIIFSYLHSSRKFIETPMEQWGLKDWEEVTPRRIGGKIYLVMLAKKKPMHFSEISEVINLSWTESRDIKSATVHNELIADDRFILIGKGIYGLKEWKGYEGGSVEDLIKKLRTKNANISEDEIIAEVSEKKLVKEATVRLALSKMRKKNK